MFTTKPETWTKFTKLGAGVSDAKSPFTKLGQPMLRRAGRSASKMVPSIIGEDLTIRGNVTSKGEIQIDGEIEGDIRCASLLLGDKSKVTGGVAAEESNRARPHSRIDQGLAHYASRRNPMWKATSSTRVLPSSRVPISKESRGAPTIHSRR